MRSAGNERKLDHGSYQGKQEEQIILLIKKIIKMWKAQEDAKMEEESANSN